MEIEHIEKSPVLTNGGFLVDLYDGKTKEEIVRTFIEKLFE